MPRSAGMRGSGLAQVRDNAVLHDADHLAHDRWTAGKQESQRVRS
jgi:hypothetical protein